MAFPQTQGLKAGCDAELPGCRTHHQARSPAANSDDSLSSNLEVTYLSC